MDGTLRPDDRRGEEVRRVEPLTGSIERGARAGDLGKAVQQLKSEPGKGLFIGRREAPAGVGGAGLIDEYEFVVHPRLAGQGRVVRGLSKHVDLKLVSRMDSAQGRSRCGMSREGSHRANAPSTRSIRTSDLSVIRCIMAGGLTNLKRSVDRGRFALALV